MKFLRKTIYALILSMVVFIGFKSYSYISLQVSKKYETQLEGIATSPVAIKEAKVQSEEIEKHKNEIKVQVVVSVVVICLLTFVLYRWRQNAA